MTSGELPRFKMRALPPIGRREPGNTIPQLFRALAIMGFGAAAFIAVSRAPAAGPDRVGAQYSNIVRG